MISEISSIENKHVKNAFDLKLKKYRDLSDMYLIEGKNIIFEAIKSKKIIKMFLTKNSNFYLEKNDFEKFLVNEKIIKKLSFNKNPFEEIAIAKKDNNNFDIKYNALILDNIQDSGNLGTILRSALAFDFLNIIIINNCVDLYNEKVISASQGAQFYLNITFLESKDIEKFFENKNFNIFGTSLEESVNIKEIELVKNKKIAIILGNEGHGISEESKKISNHLLRIEHSKSIDSLNVSQAASIIMYEINNKEQKWKEEN